VLVAAGTALLVGVTGALAFAGVLVDGAGIDDVTAATEDVASSETVLPRDVSLNVGTIGGV
jgi:hypothetical protein